MIPLRRGNYLVWPLVVIAPLLFWMQRADDRSGPGSEQQPIVTTAGETGPSVSSGADGSATRVTDPATDGGRLVLESMELGRGRTLDAVLTDLDLPADTRVRLLETVRPVLDLRRLRPETGIVVARNPAGTIRTSGDSRGAGPLHPAWPGRNGR